ncbi:MAG: hypothetical protein KBT29_00325 [Prevotellaceae bacterium]|nr:hypothetical protein [Candidatus Minthosoma caballi]
MNIETIVNQDLYTYLKSQGEVDEMLPDAPDILGKWQQIATAYIPDGIREFNGYPTVSLGWMMYIGMAVAKFWDVDWAKYDAVENLYLILRDKRGYDCMDEYIREDVLGLKGKEYDKLNALVAECASRTFSNLHHQHIEPGTKAAFEAYTQCLHQMYMMGAAVQLKRMGYHMTMIG